MSKSVRRVKIEEIRVEEVGLPEVGLSPKGSLSGKVMTVFLAVEVGAVKTGFQILLS